MSNSQHGSKVPPAGMQVGTALHARASANSSDAGDSRAFTVSSQQQSEN